MIMTLNVDPLPLYEAPLCPAGHLPLKGGDQQLLRRRLLYDFCDWRKPS